VDELGRLLSQKLGRAEIIEILKTSGIRINLMGYEKSSQFTFFNQDRSAEPWQLDLIQSPGNIDFASSFAAKVIDGLLVN